MKKDFSKILAEAARKRCIVGGFNVYGLEDAKAVIDAAEQMRAPTILMINKLALSVIPTEYWGGALKGLAERAAVPVCLHLDHASDFQTVKKAIDTGFDSVMYDGSQLPLDDNIKNTKEIVEYAHKNGKIVEAEIGAVGYSDRNAAEYKAAFTDPDEAAVFAEATGVDWLAVSIGNVHRMKSDHAKIDFDLLKQIEKQVSIPLVVHGSTGISDPDLERLGETTVAKCNIGTSLRLAFGCTLREEILANPDLFDRTEMFRHPLACVKQAVIDKMKVLSLEGFAEQV